jgi:hypothetical protein
MIMHYFGFVLFLVIFTSLMVTASTRRRMAMIAVTGVLVSTMVVIPPAAEAQTSIVQAIQAVLNVIKGVIQTALNGINTVRSAISSLYQSFVWPVQLINQAKAQITQMSNRYRNLMASILNLKLNSATLPAPQSLENLMRDHRVNNFNILTQSFGTTYGPIPSLSDASQADRDMSDMDDALALDTLKTLKASDNATDAELKIADSIETFASQSAPGSAPFLSATAVAASIQSQALTQKMLAAELRQEAAHIAHDNGFRKRGAAFTSQLRGAIVNLLQHN